MYLQKCRNVMSGLMIPDFNYVLIESFGQEKQTGHGVHGRIQ